MRKILLLAVTVCAVSSAVAQVKLGSGQISGSFETSSIYYIDDKGIGVNAPEDHFGSNNYLKVDYSWHKLSAGIQLEGYFPALQGYDIGIYGNKKFILGSKYVQWQDKNFGVLVGNVYDQFGNGLIFRSYEDRQLGFNNSLEGVHASYRFGNYVALKAMYGRPRLYTDYAGSWVRGADLSVSLGEIVGKPELMLSVEGSYVNRYEKVAEDLSAFYGVTSPNLNMWSARVNMDYAGVSLRGEYVHKGNDLYQVGIQAPAKGQAALVELGYNYNSLSVMASFRMLDHMGTMLTLDGFSTGGLGTGNTLNYLPALTRQYTYMLANLNPYQVNVEGEIGGQIDVNYMLRSKYDRYRYWVFHANFSTYYTLHRSQSMSSLYLPKGNRELLWRDINVDVERQWNKKWKTTLLYTRQEWNHTYGWDRGTYVSNIFVGDATYKINRKQSLRFELQYLHTPVTTDESHGYSGDWMAALVEFNLAPHWSFFVSDMYNHGGTGKNYYNGGFSYTYSRTRVQLSYGRNRAGYVCSGGVCRYQPAYTGVNLVLTSSF